MSFSGMYLSLSERKELPNGPAMLKELALSISYYLKNDFSGANFLISDKNNLEFDIKIIGNNASINGGTNFIIKHFWDIPSRLESVINGFLNLKIKTDCYLMKD